jgi:hypothetical protein
MDRWLDGTVCALRSCAKPILPDDAAVVVPTNEKIRARCRDSTVEKFRVLWVRNSRTCLHDACWKALHADSIGHLVAEERKLVASGSELVERYDGVRTVEEKVRVVAGLMRDAQHVVAFTGAGISTAAGIPDYRGSAGVDSKKDLGHAGAAKDDDEEEEDGDLYYQKLQPTAAHRVLVDLQQQDRVHFLITQNCDDLHGKSGFPVLLISELYASDCVFGWSKCLSN